MTKFKLEVHSKQGRSSTKPCLAPFLIGNWSERYPSILNLAIHYHHGKLWQGKGATFLRTKNKAHLWTRSNTLVKSKSDKWKGRRFSSDFFRKFSKYHIWCISTCFAPVQSFGTYGFRNSLKKREKQTHFPSYTGQWDASRLGAVKSRAFILEKGCGLRVFKFLWYSLASLAKETQFTNVLGEYRWARS